MKSPRMIFFYQSFEWKWIADLSMGNWYTFHKKEEESSSVAENGPATASWEPPNWFGGRTSILRVTYTGIPAP